MLSNDALQVGDAVLVARDGEYGFWYPLLIIELVEGGAIGENGKTRI